MLSSMLSCESNYNQFILVNGKTREISSSNSTDPNGEGLTGDRQPGKQGAQKIVLGPKRLNQGCNGPARRRGSIVVKNWTCSIHCAFGVALIVAASVMAPTASSAAPIYNMQGLLGQTHPFLNPVPPLPPLPAEPRNVRAAPQSAPASAPTLAPRPGQQRVQQKTPSNIQWQKRSGGSQPTQGTSTPYKSDSFISEMRIGALWHDQGPFSSNKEGGVDGNVELLFGSPSFLDILWAPRPHIGLSYNSSGDTSQAYLGLTWEWDFFDDFFAGFSLGGTVHDGFKTTSRLDRKELGCRVLFRESLTFGYRLSKHHSLMAFLDHSSNAKLCSRNEGLENVGIRYGYRF